MNNFINDYFAHDERFYLFFLNRNEKLEKPRSKQLYFTKASLENEIQEFEKWNNEMYVDVYYSVNTFDYVDYKITRKKEYVNKVKSLFFDIDERGPETRDTIIAALGTPTFDIQTSSEKFQLLYVLDDDKIDFNEFEKVAKTLTYYFNTDKTFDISRVARLPSMKNNKNGFEVIYKKNDIKYNFKYFVKFIEDNNIDLEEITPKLKKNKIVNIEMRRRQQLKSQSKTLTTQRKEKKKDYDFKYNEFLMKNGNDYSAADMSFVVYLQKVKKLKREETIYKHFLNVCENVEYRHKDTYKYFQDILGKIQ